jgi:transcriptional regulator with XRE-family HTH domain
MMDATVGTRVRRLRERLGMTQEALASAAACSQNSISRLERGQGRVDVEMLARVARALGVTEAQLWPGAGDDGPAPEDVWAQVDRAVAVAERSAEAAASSVRALEHLLAMVRRREREGMAGLRALGAEDLPDLPAE